jgi:hypothetical protein
VHRVERSNTQEYLKVCRKECEQEPFWRFEFVSESSGGIIPLNTSKEDGGRTTSKGDEGRSHPAEVKFRRENIDLFCKSCQGGNERSKFSVEDS